MEKNYSFSGLFGRRKKSNVGEVSVILGAYQEEITPHIEEDITVLYNPNWEEGLLSSIQAGVNEIVKNHPQIKGILLLLCDQYCVDTSLINKIVQIYRETQCMAVCCSYVDAIGVPVLYDIACFDDLQKLTPANGARKLLNRLKSRGELQTVSFPEGILDVDTEAEYVQMMQHFERKRYSDFDS